MKYTSYKLIYLEIIDITFNQTLCQSLHIPQYSLNYILYLSYIYPTFILYLSHISCPRIETAALATEEERENRIKTAALTTEAGAKRREAPRRE